MCYNPYKQAKSRFCEVIRLNLTSPSELKEILKRHGFSFSKSLGQNFLIDKNVLDKIVDASGACGEINALEIGPGAGTLSRELAARAKKLVAVEIDKALIPVLSETMAEFDNFTLINADIMDVDIAALVEEQFGGEPFIVAANLPYYITTPIIMSLLESGADVRSMTLMVQKEVALRMAAGVGKDYGALSVAVQYYTRPEIVCRAEPHCFMPQPKVASVAIKLDVLKEPAVKVKDTDVFFKVVKSAFGQRRKTLVNSLAGSPYIKIEKAAIISMLDEMGLRPDIRGEKLSIEQFAELSDRCAEYRAASGEE